MHDVQRQTHGDAGVDGVAALHIDLHIGLPIIIEDMDNAIDEAYGAAPERLYLVDIDGNVAYHGGAGPHFFDLDEWEQAIQACAVVPASR